MDHSHYVGVIQNPELKGAFPYVEFRSEPRPNTPGVLTRLSSRWFRTWQTRRMPIPVPYIDGVGKFSIHRLGVWFTTPETWYASITATIASRLLTLYSRRSKHKYIDGSTRNLIFRVASFYAFSHDNYALDRILANLRPNGLSVVKKLYRFFVSKLGETFRFVHSQTNFQVLWLTFRSKWIRDKPSIVEKMIRDSGLVYPSLRHGKFRFFGVNPFLFSLNWLVRRRTVEDTLYL